MIGEYLDDIIGEPGSLTRQLFETGYVLLRSAIIGVTLSILICQIFAPQIRQSDWLGSIFCGKGQHLDLSGETRKSRRIICRDRHGAAVNQSKQLTGAVALPFIIVLSGLGIAAVWFPGSRRKTP
jgi:hypothetical protein